jgi:hypothetical protein
VCGRVCVCCVRVRVYVLRVYVLRASVCVTYVCVCMSVCECASAYELEDGRVRESGGGRKGGCDCPLSLDLVLWITVKCSLKCASSAVLCSALLCCVTWHYIMTLSDLFSSLSSHPISSHPIPSHLIFLPYYHFRLFLADFFLHPISHFFFFIFIFVFFLLFFNFFRFYIRS